jgi:hypothetical protein
VLRVDWVYDLIKEMKKKIHPESLLNLPLVQQALSDPDFKFQARAIDAEWYYEKKNPISVSGFNPLLQTFFYPKNSLISHWMLHPEASARDGNESDLLVKEVFFMVHDYLHTWAYRCIHALAPQLKLGAVPITAKNFEDYAFAHILTEAVATIGLDYWFLCTIRFNDFCDLGSSFKSLTVSYREEFESEYQKFNPSFTAQTPKFFELLTRFYCDGVFPGFALEDIQRSPMLLSWLRHELSYGETQREYARSWFSFLCAEPMNLSSQQLQAPISVSVPWRKKLIQDMGQILWDKVKNNHEPVRFPRFDPSKIWTGAKGKEPDFRFLNLNRQDPVKAAEAVIQGRQVQRNFKHFFYQYVSGYDFASFDKELLKLFPFLLEKKDFGLIQHLFRDQKRIKSISGEPEHLFILN